MSTTGATLFGAQRMTTRMRSKRAASAMENNAPVLPSRSRPFKIACWPGIPPFTLNCNKSFPTASISLRRYAHPSFVSSPNAYRNLLYMDAFSGMIEIASWFQLSYKSRGFSGTGIS